MRTRAFQRGFTAVEVMVVIAIIAIIAAFALPAMNQLIRTQKVRSAAYDIFSDLTYARGEAIARGHNVMVASANATDWTQGWTIRDTTSGEMLRTQNKLSLGLTFSADVASLTFDRSGRTANNASFNILPSDAGTIPDTQKRCVRISPSGRPASQNGICPAWQ